MINRLTPRDRSFKEVVLVKLWKNYWGMALKDKMKESVIQAMEIIKRIKYLMGYFMTISFNFISVFKYNVTMHHVNRQYASFLKENIPSA